MEVWKDNGARCDWTDKTSSETPGKSQRPSLGGSSLHIPVNTAKINNVSISVSATCRQGQEVPPMFTRATPLLHVTDKISGETFLVDTGAEVSIITPRPGDKEAAVGAKLTAANGSGITTYGRRTRRIRLQCGGFSWSFIVRRPRISLWQTCSGAMG